eukprot:457298_1
MSTKDVLQEINNLVELFEISRNEKSSVLSEWIEGCYSNDPIKYIKHIHTFCTKRKSWPLKSIVNDLVPKITTFIHHNMHTSKLLVCGYARKLANTILIIPSNVVGIIYHHTCIDLIVKSQIYAILSFNHICSGCILRSDFETSLDTMDIISLIQSFPKFTYFVTNSSELSLTDLVTFKHVCCRMLSEISDGNKNLLSQVIKANLIPSLMYILEKETINTSSEILMAFECMIWNENNIKIQYLIDNGLVQSICIHIRKLYIHIHESNNTQTTNRDNFIKLSTLILSINGILDKDQNYFANALFNKYALKHLEKHLENHHVASLLYCQRRLIWRIHLRHCKINNLFNKIISTYLFQNVTDQMHYQQLFQMIENWCLIQNLNIPYCINKEIAEYATGLLKCCAGCYINDISVLFGDKKLYNNKHDYANTIGYKYCDDQYFCSDCMVKAKFCNFGCVDKACLNQLQLPFITCVICNIDIFCCEGCESDSCQSTQWHCGACLDIVICDNCDDVNDLLRFCCKCSELVCKSCSKFMEGSEMESVCNSCCESYGYQMVPCENVDCHIWMYFSSTVDEIAKNGKIGNYCDKHIL